MPHRALNPTQIARTTEMESLTVVIIEDEEAHFELMKRAISREYPFASIHHFSDPGACIERIGEICPHAIVADYLIPGMDGLEILRTLKEGNITIPVVMITGQGDQNIAVQAMKLGAWDYLVKSPDCFTLLPSILERVVREKKLRESLLETERRFRDLAESTSDWIWEMDAEGRFIYSNPLVESILGYRPEEVIGRHFFEFLPGRERGSQCRAFSEIVSERKPVSAFVYTLVHKNGYEVIAETSAVPILGKDGALLGYRGIDRNITMRKRAEEHIHYLTQQLLKAQETERQKLSCDLHDTIGQDLSTLKIGLDTLLDDMPDAPRGLSDKVARLSRMLQDTISNVRDLAYTLRPATLDQLGLVRTVDQYCEEFSARHGIRVDFFSAGMEDLRPGFDTSIVLYRLIQEGLNNIRKHAEVGTAMIKLVASFPKVILCIEDSGKGFDVQDRLASALDDRCMGLKGMEERVALLEGRMKIESRPMQGTRIRIEIPYKEDRCIE